MELNLQDVATLGFVVDAPGVRGHRRAVSLLACRQWDVVLPVLYTSAIIFDFVLLYFAKFPTCFTYNLKVTFKTKLQIDFIVQILVACVC